MNQPKSRHTPTELRTIRGFPETLKLVRMPASKFWYVRMYMKGSGFVKKSTRCENFNDASQFAIDWYEDRIIEKKSHRLI